MVGIGPFRVLAPALLLALAAPAPSAVAAPAAVPGEVIVGFKPSAAAAERRVARAAVDGELKRPLRLPRTQLIEVDGSAFKAARRLGRRPDVAYAHPNYIWQMSAVPNDPRYNELWGMSKISAPAAWDVTTGSDAVTVAVLDSGVDMDHPDLNANIWRNPGEAGGGKENDGVDNDGNGMVDDWRGWDFTDSDNDPHDGAAAHGTHVAGTIGARGNNGVGVTGVNWNVKVMPVRIGTDDLAIDVAKAVDASDYAARNGAQIINMSFGGPVAAGQPIPEAQRQAIRRNSDVLFVIAAGNETNDNDAEGGARYPCNFASEPNAICVAATDQQDALAEYSNFGPQNVHLAAPGSSILSTQPLGQIHDDFELDVPGRWKAIRAPLPGVDIFFPNFQNDDMDWARTDEKAKSGSFSWHDSPGGQYVPPTNTGFEFSTLLSSIYDPSDLSQGTQHCWVDFDWLPEPGGDVYESGLHNLHVETSDADFFLADSWLLTVTRQLHNAAHFPNVWQHFNGPIAPLHLLKNRIRLRFRLESSAGAPLASPGNGVYIDNVRYWCGPPVPPAYKENDGTSMAAPHVAGAAALVLARRPNATPAELKQALLGSVDVLPGLAGKVATSGRMNVRRALGYTGPPEVSISAGPQGAITDRTPTFTFGVGGGGGAAAGASDANVSFQCRLDGSAFVPCTSPVTTPELALGEHSFAVRAVDPGGSAGSPATASFKIVDELPVLSKLKLKPKRFRPRDKGKSIVKKGGARVSYKLSTSGRVRFKVERRKSGRFVKVKGKFVHKAKAGRNRFRFSGRLRGSALKAGRYRLVAQARDAAGTKSNFARRKFKIKRKR